LRHDVRYDGAGHNWTARHRDWLAKVEFGEHGAQLTLHDYLGAIDARAGLLLIVRTGRVALGYELRRSLPARSAGRTRRESGGPSAERSPGLNIAPRPVRLIVPRRSSGRSASTSGQRLRG
jgi:hypothetical protein